MKFLTLLVCLLITFSALSPALSQVVIINNPTPIEFDPVTINSEQGPDIIVDPLTGSIVIQYQNEPVIATLIRSSAGIFNGVAPQWDGGGPLFSNIPTELANLSFGSYGGFGATDDLGQVIKTEFRGRSPHFYQGDLTPSFVVVPVPEPSGFALGITAIGLLAPWGLTVYCRRLIME